MLLTFTGATPLSITIIAGSAIQQLSGYRGSLFQYLGAPGDLTEADAQLRGNLTLWDTLV